MTKNRFIQSAFIALLFSATALAQSTTGTIYGTITDTTGAKIPAATVTLKDVDTGIQNVQQSDGSGNYIFQLVKPGNYTVTASRDAFRTVTQSGIALASDANIQASFQLSPGSVRDQITVQADASMVDTRSSQLGETIDQQRIQNLPLNGRDPYDLVQTLPGATNYTAAAPVGGKFGAKFSFNGQRVSYNSFYLDGAANTSFFQGTSNKAPNPDAVQEFRVLSSNFDAEYGRTPGAVVNVITRSGTSAYHGLLYEYLRNDAFNAINYFQTTKAALKQNQFGGTLGGPILRDKLFGFFSYQGLLIHTPMRINPGGITLTQAESQGDFRNSKTKPTKGYTPCNGVQYTICATAFDPVAVNFIKFFPGFDSSGAFLSQQAAANVVSNEYTGRLDTDVIHHHLALTVFDSKGNQTNPGANGNQLYSYSGIVTNPHQFNSILNDTWIVSSNAVNNARIYFTQNHVLNANIYNSHYLADLGSQQPQGNLLITKTQPSIAITGYVTGGMNNAGPNDSLQSSIGFADTFSLSRGNHQLKFGGVIQRYKYMENGSFYNSGRFVFAAGSTTGNAFADFLLGKPNQFIENSGTFHHLHQWDPALFAQDDWKVLSRLTLNLGLRWEVFPPFAGENNTGTFVQGVQSTRFPTAPIGLLSSGDSGVPDGTLITTYDKFAPRAGFAIDVFGNGRTSLRGGYGLFYSFEQESITATLEQQPFTLSVTLAKPPSSVTPFGTSPNPFPYTVNLQSPSFTTAATISGLRPQEKSIPYSQEFNLTAEQQFTASTSLRVAYVGSVSRHFEILRDTNAPVFAAGAATTAAALQTRRPIQPYAAIAILDASSNANYNSLQVTLNRRFSGYFQVFAAYVWSKAMDDYSADAGAGSTFLLSDQTNIRRDYGLSDLHVPNRFVASYLFHLPGTKHFGLFGREVLSGWQVNGITTLASGGPINVTSGVDTSLDGIATDRPDLIGDARLGNDRSKAQRIAQYFNTAAYVLPTGPYGSAHRNSVLGPGLIRTDFSGFKSFPLIHETALQFRAEAFNVFNHANLDAPNGGMTAAAFGRITTAEDPRILQFALRLSF